MGSAHEVWDLYVFDWFKATATALVGSKMCCQILIRVLECRAKFVRICLRFCEMAAMLNLKNHIFGLSSQFSLFILTKLSREIAEGKGHLVCESDLK